MKHTPNTIMVVLPSYVRQHCSFSSPSTMWSFFTPGKYERSRGPPEIPVLLTEDESETISKGWAKGDKGDCTILLLQESCPVHLWSDILSTEAHCTVLWPLVFLRNSSFTWIYTWKKIHVWYVMKILRLDDLFGNIINSNFIITCIQLTKKSFNLTWENLH